MGTQTQSTTTEYLRDAEVYNQNKNITTFWVLLATQILYCIMYGLFMKTQASSVLITSEDKFVQICLIFIMIIVGFGLIFGIYSKIGWSAVGFNLFISAICIETYFLINAFWTKVNIHYTGPNFQTPQYSIYLTYSDTSTSSNEYSAVFVEALKCSLACIVAFSFILGRAGPLQAYLVSIFGTILYELTRQICLIRTEYEAGSLKIFLFGSFLGLMLSILLRRKQAPILANQNLFKTNDSVIFALVGLIIYWVAFPLLAFDSSVGFPAHEFNSASLDQPVIISMVFSMASATTIGIIFSFINSGFHSVITCSLAGGIVGLSSAAFITNPVFAILIGVLAALFQQIFLQLDEKCITPRFGPIDKLSYVFISQSILSLGLGAWNKAMVNGYTDNLTLTWGNTKADGGMYFGNGWVFAAIGMAVGILLGIVISCLTYHEKIDHFNDLTYWRREDGIRTTEQQVEKKLVFE